MIGACLKSQLLKISKAYSNHKYKLNMACMGSCACIRMSVIARPGPQYNSSQYILVIFLIMLSVVMPLKLRIFLFTVKVAGLLDFWMGWSLMEHHLFRMLELSFLVLWIVFLRYLSCLNCIEKIGAFIHSMKFFSFGVKLYLYK